MVNATILLWLLPCVFSAGMLTHALFFCEDYDDFDEDF